MALPWVRLDTSMPDNPKILDLCLEKDGHRAAFVWICCLAYAGKHGTAGFIPRSAVPVVRGRNADMARLVSARLLTESAGGWDINGWDEFQISDESQARRRESAKKAAAIRWSKDEAAKSRRRPSKGA